MQFDQLYENYVVRPSEAYRSAIESPAEPLSGAMNALIAQLQTFQGSNAGLAFWQIIAYKTLSHIASGGDVHIFGQRLCTMRDFILKIHPQYLLPYFRWRAAGYTPILQNNFPIDLKRIILRQSIPLKAKDGQYYWFSMFASTLQIDAAGRIVSNLHTFYLEGKWSPKTMRPFEASVQLDNWASTELDQNLVRQLTPDLIDEFTDAELDLISLYASGKSTEEVIKAKNWSRYTLHEYNANLLKKSKALFVYDFRNAREFAEYCLEKGYIHLR